ncbi:MAG: TfoX/Sxy family protein [Pseudomonadota bacterium]|nr:TfoX/Sxy family protein [Pseudomonadota bacterium]
MAYSERLAQRVRNTLAGKNVVSVETKMMGGLCFMVDDKMCVGIDQDRQGDDRLMVRVDPDASDALLTRPHVSPMDLTGRPMKGFLFVHADGIAGTKQLATWIQLALNFNPRAVSSKRGKSTARN